jgi:hypothetical protein
MLHATSYFQKIVIFLDALNQMDDDGNMLYLLAFKVRSHDNIFGPIYPFNSLSSWCCSNEMVKNLKVNIKQDVARYVVLRIPPLVHL